MPKFTEKISITAPAEQVFDHLAELENVPQWLPAVTQVRRTSTTARGAGLQAEVVAVVNDKPARGTVRCLSGDRPRQLVVQAVLDNGVTSIAAFVLTPQAQQTVLLARFDYTIPAKGVKRFVGGLVSEPIVKRHVREALEKLKQQVESAPTGARTARPG